jgi:hypothetical protein
MFDARISGENFHSFLKMKKAVSYLIKSSGKPLSVVPTVQFWKQNMKKKKCLVTTTLFLINMF